MEFDRLGEAWRQVCGAGKDRDPAADVETVRARAAALDRAVRRRDRIEIGLSVVLVVFFGWVALTTPERISALGAWILVLSFVLTPIRLRLARRRAPDPGEPLAAALEAELERIRAQERLLGSVAWWYVAPPTIGLILLVGGSDSSAVFRIVYTVLLLVLGVTIVLLNLRTARREFGPLARELETWLADLERPDGGASNE